VHRPRESSPRRLQSGSTSSSGRPSSSVTVHRDAQRGAVGRASGPAGSARSSRRSYRGLSATTRPRFRELVAHAAGLSIEEDHHDNRD
jgi:hypothetical protein